MEQRLYNVRDLHWLSPNNVRNSGNTPSSKTTFVGYDTGVAQTGVTYRENRIVFSGSSTEIQYPFRLTSDFLVPTHIKVKMHAANIDAKLYIDDLEIGDVWSFSNIQEVQETILPLSDYHLERILKYRFVPDYENYRIECVNDPSAVGSGLEPVSVYGFEVSLSGTDTYQNYVTNNLSSNTKLLPTGVFSTNVYWKNHDNSNLNVERFNSSPTGIGVNSTYIEAQNEPTIHNSLPSGFLSVLFSSNSTETIGVNRALLSFNMSLPVSGSKGNYRDKIDVYGKSRTYNYSFNSLINDDWLNELVIGSEESEPDVPSGLHPLSSPLWGYSNIVENSGFLTYNIDLVFTDPEKYLTPSNSGNTSSRKYAHLAAFKDLELKFVGVPSGAQLSAMELTLETQTANTLNLFMPSAYIHDESLDSFISGKSSSSSFTDMLTIGHANISTIENFYSDEYFGVWGIDESPQLYIYGKDLAVNDTDLFLKTNEYINSSVTLYSIGAIPETNNSDMDLFIEGLTPSTTNNSLSLVIKSSANTSIFALSNLFIKSLDYDPNVYIPLYVSSIDSDSIDSSMNLFVGNNIDSSFELNLFLANYNQEIFGSKKLFLKGARNYVYNDSMNLYIARDSEGLSATSTLFIKTVDGSNSTSPLFVYGAYYAASDLDEYSVDDYAGVWMIDFNLNYLTMTISGIDSEQNKYSDLFISGF